MFIDETRRTSKNKLFLCLCGIIVDSSDVIKLEKRIKFFKKRYGFKNLKDFRRYNGPKKVDITNELFQILNSINIKIISAVILESSLESIHNNSKDIEADERLFVLKFILERFNIRLNRKKKSGLIIFDSLDRKSENKMKRTFFRKFSKNIRRVFPSLLFSNDEHSNILQVVDLIGVALNSALFHQLNKNSNIDVNDLPNHNKYLKIYWPLFESNPNNGSVNGWGLKVWY